VTEADIQRVQENARQIKKIAKQLQQNKKENNQLAEFLTFLLSEISNDNIIK
jgi:DNA repair ATPase RecN